MWETSNQEDRIEANALLEKYFMCRIYTSYELSDDYSGTRGSR